MGLAEIVIMTEMWSEVVAAPGVMRIFWNIREVARVMSGEVEQFLRIRVGKLGHRCWSNVQCIL